MKTTDWLYIRNVIEKDDKFIFVTETVLRQLVIIKAPKRLFGIFGIRRPRIRDQAKFHLDDDNHVVGFEKMEY